MNTTLHPLTLLTYELSAIQQQGVEQLCLLARLGQTIELEHYLSLNLSDTTQEVLIDAALHELALSDQDALSFGRVLSAARRSSQIIGDSRLCSVLILASGGNTQPTPTVLTPQTLESFARLGIRAYPILMSIEEVSSWNFSKTQRFHQQLCTQDFTDMKVQPQTTHVNGSGAIPCLVLLSISTRTALAWDQQPPESIGLAFASCVEILQNQQELHPITANYFSNTLDQAEMALLPFAFLLSMHKATALSHCTPNEVSFSVSFHPIEGESTDSLMRVAARSKSDGLFLDGFEATKPLIDEAQITELCAIYAAQAGSNELYMVQGPLGPMVCPICSEVLYPLPEEAAWITAAAEAGVPIDGSHHH